jgi:hypothetical protein
MHLTEKGPKLTLERHAIVNQMPDTRKTLSPPSRLGCVSVPHKKKRAAQNTPKKSSKEIKIPAKLHTSDDLMCTKQNLNRVQHAIRSPSFISLSRSAVRAAAVFLHFEKAPACIIGLGSTRKKKNDENPQPKKLILFS